MIVWFTKVSQHYRYVKSSLSLYKKDDNNKGRTPSSTNVRRSRTYCAKAPHTLC